MAHERKKMKKCLNKQGELAGNKFGAFILLATLGLAIIEAIAFFARNA